LDLFEAGFFHWDLRAWERNLNCMTAFLESRVPELSPLPRVVILSLTLPLSHWLCSYLILLQNSSEITWFPKKEKMIYQILKIILSRDFFICIFLIILFLKLSSYKRIWLWPSLFLLVFLKHSQTTLFTPDNHRNLGSYWAT
jgi:hypothetical protein